MNNRIHRIHTNDGFTLLEVVLYMALVAVLIGSALPFFTSLQRAQSKQEQAARVAEEYLFLDARIRDFVKNATAVVEPRPGEYGDRLIFDTENRGRFTLESRVHELVLVSEEENTITKLSATGTRIAELGFYQPQSMGPQRLLANVVINDQMFGTSTIIFRNE